MKYKYFARKGTFCQVYFCCAPWVEVGATRWWFEKLIMGNKCLKRERVMPAIKQGNDGAKQGNNE